MLKFGTGQITTVALDGGETVPPRTAGTLTDTERASIITEDDDTDEE